MQPWPRDLTTVVYSGTNEVEARLNELGLKREDLLEAIRYGSAHAAECTAHDPSSLLGLVFWGKCVRRLRDILIPSGWSVSNRGNFPVTVHPSGQWAIAVASGDEHTGIPARRPRHDTKGVQQPNKLCTSTN